MSALANRKPLKRLTGLRFSCAGHSLESLTTKQFAINSGTQNVDK